VAGILAKMFQDTQIGSYVDQRHYWIMCSDLPIYSGPNAIAAAIFVGTDLSERDDGDHCCEYDFTFQEIIMVPGFPAEWKFMGEFVAAVIIACSASYGSWYVTSDHYEKIIAQYQINADKAVQSQFALNQQLALIHADKIRLAEEQHAADQITITRLGNQLSRVQVHLARNDCGSVSGGNQTAADQNGRAELFYEAADAAFANLQRGDDEDFQRCDQLNIDAIEVNAQH